MAKKTPSLSKFLKKKQPNTSKDLDKTIESLQFEILKVQQGLWHRRKRAIFIFEGFDAAGKGGTIRALTEKLDPRGVRVHPIGPPSVEEQSKHYLYRFWKNLPEPGLITIFDRSWYGRVLVEKVEKLAPKERIEEAYKEIRHFEQMLINDGIHLMKFFLAVSKEEQLARYEERLNNPYKRWKISEDDLRARRKWNDYVAATDRIFDETHDGETPWHLVGSDHKPQAHVEVLSAISKELHEYSQWNEKEAGLWQKQDLRKELKKMIQSCD